MRTTIDIDDALLKRAMKLSKTKTKKEAIEIALRMYLQVGRQKSIKKNMGKINWRGDLAEMRGE